MADSETLDPSNPVDANLLNLKNEIESRPDWAQTKARIELEHGTGRSISPSDLNASPPRDRADIINAQVRAEYEAKHGQAPAEQQRQEQPPSDDPEALMNAYGFVPSPVEVQAFRQMEAEL